MLDTGFWMQDKNVAILMCYPETKQLVTSISHVPAQFSSKTNIMNKPQNLFLEFCILANPVPADRTGDTSPK